MSEQFNLMWVSIAGYSQANLQAFFEQILSTQDQKFVPEISAQEQDKLLVYLSSVLVDFSSANAVFNSALLMATQKIADYEQSSERFSELKQQAFDNAIAITAGMCLERFGKSGCLSFTQIYQVISTLIKALKAHSVLILVGFYNVPVVFEADVNRNLEDVIAKLKMHACNQAENSDLVIKDSEPAVSLSELKL